MGYIVRVIKSPPWTSSFEMYSSFISEKLIPPRAVKNEYAIHMINHCDTLVSPIISYFSILFFKNFHKAHYQQLPKMHIV